MKSMKTLCSLAFLAAQIAVGQEPSLFDSEYGRASQLVYALGLGQGSESTNLYTWTLPLFFVSDNGETNVVARTAFSSSDGSIRTGMSYSSPLSSGKACVYACTNHFDALRELLFPTIAFSSSSVSSHTNRFVTSTTDFGMVLISGKESDGSLNGNNIRVCIGNVAVFVEGDQPLSTALSLLRAGGVDIPEEPLRSSPPSSPPAQAMRVFSSDPPEDASSSPPAPEPFQAMLVFPSDLENETDSSASESRPESESEQEF